ncbi:Hint domain-containing protein [Methylosinus sp. RM1]|uniref:Hint domain-containing protein n=1 Tax=Methylosinus sp. RM1 TaxID=2583817 RepID=UPI00140D08F0|nr:Hint domain-containing protein [Methylosinus sp. RM1]
MVIKMGTSTVNYTIPANVAEGTPGIDVTLNLTYADAVNSDGSHTVTSATGTYTVNGTVYNVVGVVDPSGSPEGADNHFWPGGDGPNGAYVDYSGVNFITDYPAANGNQTGGNGSYVGPNVDLYYDPRQQAYLQDTGVQKSPLAATNFSATVTCFVTGTRIRTTRGEIAVENLRVGDLVVTTEGRERPIVWIGHRKIDCTGRAQPRDAWPVRIAAGAFGENRPARDLYVSPGHGLCVECVGEALIHAQSLVNGATITRVPVETVDYWHVELESHDILIAENLPSESYSATGERGFFLHIQGSPASERRLDSDFCRPFASPAMIAAVRERLVARAERSGYSREFDPDVRLLVDGAEIAPIRANGSAIFSFPRAAQDIRLVSTSFVPADDSGLGGDTRRLGVSLSGLVATDGREIARIPFDDPQLAAFFHPEEASEQRPWRWTREEGLALPPSLFAQLSGAQIALIVAYNCDEMRGWAPPLSRSEAEERALRGVDVLIAEGREAA